MSKTTINRRRNEGESLKSAAKRLAGNTEDSVGTKAAQAWLTAKKYKPNKKAPTAKPMEAAPITNGTKTKRR